MNYTLPVTIELQGKSYDIRTDFRVALDIISALNDVELTDTDRALTIIEILYVNWQEIPYKAYKEALVKALEFINIGKTETDKKRSPQPKLMDWEQDFNYIVSPINRILGYDCRGKEYLHWWTFYGAFCEIGECSFSNIVSIRNKRIKGKKLDETEKEYYLNNRDVVDIKRKLTAEQQKEQEEVKRKIQEHNRKIKEQLKKERLIR